MGFYKKNEYKITHFEHSNIVKYRTKERILCASVDYKHTSTLLISIETTHR